jgi:hypothetical protein
LIGDKAVLGKQKTLVSAREDLLLKISLKQKSKKIPFSLESVEAKKVSLNGEFNNWDLHADRVYCPHWDKSTDPVDVIKMVPCPPCVWG